MYQSRCTAKNSWWWAERLPETWRIVIPINLEFSASVGFIYKESVTMHGHTIVKVRERERTFSIKVVSYLWIHSYNMLEVCIRLMEESMQFVLCQILYLSIHYSMYAAITSQIAQNVQISALALTLYCKYPWPSTSDISGTAALSCLSIGAIPSSALCFQALILLSFKWIFMWSPLPLHRFSWSAQTSALPPYSAKVYLHPCT